MIILFVMAVYIAFSIFIGVSGSCGEKTAAAVMTGGVFSA